MKIPKTQVPAEQWAEKAEREIEMRGSGPRPPAAARNTPTKATTRTDAGRTANPQPPMSLHPNSRRR